MLGPHVKQAGSLVSPGRLRFDFSHFVGVEDEELQDIEDIVNKEVLRNQKVEVIEDVPIDVAVNEYKAMALFGEKYGDNPANYHGESYRSSRTRNVFFRFRTVRPHTGFEWNHGPSELIRSRWTCTPAVFDLPARFPSSEPFARSRQAFPRP